MKPTFVSWIAVSLVALTSSGAFARKDEHKKRFQFALIGDTGYAQSEVDLVSGLLAEISATKVEFVMHMGDFKSQNAPQPCTDAAYLAVHDQFNAFSKHPLIYTPGDNEWTDCTFSGPPGSIAEERLAKLREIFFPGAGTDPLYSLGQFPMQLESQSSDAAHSTFRENTAWEFGEIMFAMVNVPDGDNQGVTRCLEFDAAKKCLRTGIDDSEWRARTAANVAWINAAFDRAIAEGMKGVVIGTQANFIGNFFPTRYNPNSPRYKAVLEAIKSGTKRFGSPVLLVHGDTHCARIDTPYAALQYPELAPATGGVFTTPAQYIGNLTRVEVPGSTSSSQIGVEPQRWWRVKVDTDTRRVFTVIDGEIERGDRNDEGDDD